MAPAKSAAAAAIAGLFPAICKALDLNVSLEKIADNANRFKTLQNCFCYASHICATNMTEYLEEEFKTLMQRMDDALSANLTIPDRHTTVA